MKAIINQTVFIFLIAASLWLLYKLSPILTPFLLGALLAYLANPMVERLQKWGVSHVLSVILVFVFVFCLFIGLILMLIPIIHQQLVAFMQVIPQIIAWIEEAVVPFIQSYVQNYIDLDTMQASFSSSLPKAAVLITKVLESSYTVIEWLVSFVLTPVVTFYLLRDWRLLLTGIEGLLPQSIKPTVIQLARDCDEVLSAFFRGQLLVMLCLGVIYGVGLSLVGLKVGLIIGLIGGLLSIVPYLGSMFVLIIASLTALVEYGVLQPVLYVWLVFLIGQTIEAYILTPYFVGERIGLHPVAVIFSVMAGGALFGFFGVLIALPLAAVIMVLLRFLRQQYE